MGTVTIASGSIEPIEVLARLGQFMNVKITGRDYVEGKVQLIPEN